MPHPLALILALLPQGQPPQQLAHEIAAYCAISPERLAVEIWTDEIHGAGGPTIIVKGKAPFSRKQISCLGTLAAEREVGLAFEDDRLGQQYDTYLVQQRVRIGRQMVAWARQALHDAGLLKRVPRHDPRSESLAAFAIRIERFCGARPGSVLIAQDDRIDLAPEGIDDTSHGPTSPSACAINVATVVGYNPWRWHLREPPPVITQ